MDEKIEILLGGEIKRQNDRWQCVGRLGVALARGRSLNVSVLGFRGDPGFVIRVKSEVKVNGDEKEMKGPRKNKPLMSDDEIAGLVNRSFPLDLPNFEDTYREAVAEAVKHLRGNEKQSVQNAKRQADSRQKERLFLVTHALMIEFYERSKIGPTFVKDAGISRRTAIAISDRVPLSISTIQKCFENPSSVERPSRAIGARQLICLALGSRADAFSIEGDRVSFRNEEALLGKVQRALDRPLDPVVKVGDLELAIYEADTHRRNVAKNMKLGG